MRQEVEAVGTNAHELPMVYAALANSDEEMARSPYRVLADWQEDYEGNLLVILPDTYGTTNFLANAPEWVPSWTGIRVDSKDPIEGGEEAIAWWRERGQNPAEKLAIFSDGLDVDVIERIHNHFRGRMRIGYGWGTLLTNDFRGLAPEGASRPDLHRLQGHLRRWPSDGEAVGQSDEGDGTERGGRTLQACVPCGRAKGAARSGVSAMKVDLNCDMGEGFGPWPMGDDEAMLDIVSSANIACGFHAGDPSIMFRTARDREAQGRGHRRASRLQRPAWLRPPLHQGRYPCRDRAHDRLSDRRPCRRSHRLPGTRSLM